MQASEEINVIKRDGSEESFQNSKVRGSMIFAGATCEQAELITKQIELWTVRNAKDKKIETQKIRKRVIELLKGQNPQAAKSYESFKKE